MSAMKGSREVVISGKQKDSVQGEMPAAPATMTICVGKYLLLQDRRHRMTQKGSSKGKATSGSSLSGRRCQRQDYWHPPVCQKWIFRHKEVHSQLN